MTIKENHMWKKRKIDFVISENDYKKVIFRFYPRSSTCHSFNDQLPTKWEDVYKVYYHYKVICIYKDDNEHIILFDSGVDECSVIDEVSSRIKLIVDGTTIYKGTTKDGESFSIHLLDNEVLPFGDGVSWNIHKHFRRCGYSGPSGRGSAGPERHRNIPGFPPGGSGPCQSGGSPSPRLLRRLPRCCGCFLQYR